MTRPSRLLGLAFFGALLAVPALALAQDAPSLSLSLAAGQTSPDRVSTLLEILFALTVLSLAPSFVLTVTSFTRIIVVLSILRQAIGLQQSPSNQILIGLSLFLTLFIMTPVFDRINEEALQPYLNEQITSREAFDKAQLPLHQFMLG